MRKHAAQGDFQAVDQLSLITASNSFFPGYISFISQTDTNILKKHLITVITRWYGEIIVPNLDRLEKILQIDTASKEKMKDKLHPEAFVQWATSGVEYLPEPGVHEVCAYSAIYLPTVEHHS